MTTPSSPTEPSLGHVELWRARHDEFPRKQVRIFESWLTPEERARQLRYRRPQDQLRFAVGRGMLRRLLQHYTGRPASTWHFQLGEYGRPELGRSDAESNDVPHFNLSHSQGVTIAVFGQGVDKLGADVEAIDRTTHWNLARRYFASTEAQTVEEACDSTKGELFLRYWTLKEAFVKAVGQGISFGLDNFAFQLSDTAPPQVAFAQPEVARPERWHFFELPNQTERMAVAIESPKRPQLALRDFNTDQHDARSLDE